MFFKDECTQCVTENTRGVETLIFKMSYNIYMIWYTVLYIIKSTSTNLNTKMSQFPFSIRVTERGRDRGSKLRCGIKSKYFLRTQKFSRSLTTRIFVSIKYHEYSSYWFWFYIKPRERWIRCKKKIIKKKRGEIRKWEVYLFFLFQSDLIWKNAPLILWRIVN